MLTTRVRIVLRREEAGTDTAFGMELSQFLSLGSSQFGPSCDTGGGGALSCSLTLFSFEALHDSPFLCREVRRGSACEAWPLRIGHACIGTVKAAFG